MEVLLRQPEYLYKKVKLIFICVLFLFTNLLKAQTLYFPPLSGNTWDTISPSRLGWCQPRIDSLYSFLTTHGTDGFVMLKNGKIVLEKYFGRFRVDSVHTWESMGKSLTSVLVGISAQNNMLNIGDSVCKYLGMGWTAETPAEERNITLRNLLTMTSGLNPYPPNPCSDLEAKAIHVFVPLLANIAIYLASSALGWGAKT